MPNSIEDCQEEPQSLPLTPRGRANKPHDRKYTSQRCKWVFLYVGDQSGTGENVSLGICEQRKPRSASQFAVWSRPSLSTARITGYYRMYQWRAKARMRPCAYAVWSESIHFVHASRQFFAWRGPAWSLLFAWWKLGFCRFYLGRYKTQSWRRRCEADLDFLHSPTVYVLWIHFFCGMRHSILCIFIAKR